MLPRRAYSVNKESPLVFPHEPSVEPHSHSVPHLARKTAACICVSVSVEQGQELSREQKMRFSNEDKEKLKASLGQTACPPTRNHETIHTFKSVTQSSTVFSLEGLPRGRGRYSHPFVPFEPNFPQFFLICSV